MTQIIPPAAPFCDEHGIPLQGGYVYVGSTDTPSPVSIQYLDGSDGGMVATPLRTIDGYLAYNGRKVAAYANGDTTPVFVFDRNMRKVMEADL